MSTAVIPTVSSRARRRVGRSAAFAGVVVAFSAFFVAAGAPTALLPSYQEHWRFAPWMSTLAFGVYAIGLLAALLVFGRLSDHIGRRPLVIGSLTLELTAMAMFLAAPSIGWLIAARIVQGVATGTATGAFSAAIVELAPERRKQLGAVLSSIAGAAGLALGALLAGTAAQVDAAAATTVWSVLVLIMLAGTVFALFVPETSSPRPGAAASLVPRVTVPAPARRQFRVTVPTQLGAWMTAALFMGLMPIILGTVFAIHSSLVIGATSFLEPATAAVVSVVASKARAQRLSVVGGIAVIAGVVIVVVAVVTAVLPLLWLGGVVGGIGFGATFSGNVRLLTPEVRDHERAGLFAAVYLVAYLAFGVPAMAAGLLVGAVGVVPIAVGFGLVVAVLAGIGLIGQLRLAR
jgi:MFS family permease